MNYVQVLRKWYNGRIDCFSIDELQRQIIKPELSKHFEYQRKYMPLQLFDIEIAKYDILEPLNGKIFIPFNL